MSFILKQDSSTWAQEAAGELELLESYFKAQEQSVETLFLNYKDRAVEHEIGDDEHVDVVTVVDGLDDQTWHLPSIYEEYFPNLHRKSHLVTLCIFLEDQLQILCARIKEERQLRVSVGDLRLQGIPRAVNYLTKVAGVRINRGNNTYQHINGLRLARNMIVHNNGRIDPQPSPLRNYVENHGILEGDEIVVSAEFVTKSLRVVANWLRLIGQAIREQS